jgi:hypothetical protein
MEDVMHRFLSMAVVTAAGAVLSISGAHASDWKPAGESDGVSLFARTEPNQDLTYFRGVTRINAPMKHVLAAVLVRETTPQWFANMLEDSTLKDNNPDASYAYVWIKGVWPTSDRDTVIHVNVEQDPVTLAVSVTAQSAEQERVPPVKGRVRMPNMYSRFTIKAVSANVTEVGLDGVADPGGHIPTFATNAVASKLPAKTLANLRNRLETPGQVDLNALETVRFAALAMQKIKLPQ